MRWPVEPGAPAGGCGSAAPGSGGGAAAVRRPGPTGAVSGWPAGVKAGGSGAGAGTGCGGISGSAEAVVPAKPRTPATAAATPPARSRQLRTFSNI